MKFAHHVPPLPNGHEGAQGGGEPKELVVRRPLVAQKGVVVEGSEYRGEAEGEYLQYHIRGKKKKTPGIDIKRTEAQRSEINRKGQEGEGREGKGRNTRKGRGS